MLRDDAKGEGEAELERAEVGVSGRERERDEAPLTGPAPFVLLTLSLRDQKPLLCATPNVADGTCGVENPGVGEGALRCNASEAARSRRLVVPRAFVEPERAEHTTTILC